MLLEEAHSPHTDTLMNTTTRVCLQVKSVRTARVLIESVYIFQTGIQLCFQEFLQFSAFAG